MRKMLSLTALAGSLVAASAAQADITIGFVTSLSGPGSSIGIPYGRGIAAAVEYKNEVNGEKIKLIQLDDGSDPSAATRNARKLIEEEKVDLLIGTATAPFDHRDDGGRERTEGSDDRRLSGDRATKRRRSMGHFGPATSVATGQGRRRAHEAR